MIELAQQLADEMSSDGHEVTGLDILDYLAICGFEIRPSQAASAAYIEAVTQEKS